MIFFFSHNNFVFLFRFGLVLKLDYNKLYKEKKNLVQNLLKSLRIFFFDRWNMILGG